MQTVLSNPVAVAALIVAVILAVCVSRAAIHFTHKLMGTQAVVKTSTAAKYISYIFIAIFMALGITFSIINKDAPSHPDFAQGLIYKTVDEMGVRYVRFSGLIMYISGWACLAGAMLSNMVKSAAHNRASSGSAKGVTSFTTDGSSS